MTYVIKIEKRVSKQLAKLDTSVSALIYSKIRQLSHDPRPPQSKKLVGTPEWRLRVGTYRVIYLIKDSELVVLIVRVAHRKDVC